MSLQELLISTLIEIFKIVTMSKLVVIFYWKLLCCFQFIDLYVIQHQIAFEILAATESKHTFPCRSTIRVP